MNQTENKPKENGNQKKRLWRKMIKWRARRPRLKGMKVFQNNKVKHKHKDKMNEDALCIYLV